MKTIRLLLVLIGCGVLTFAWNVTADTTAPPPPAGQPADAGSKVSSDKATANPPRENQAANNKSSPRQPAAKGSRVRATRKFSAPTGGDAGILPTRNPGDIQARPVPGAPATASRTGLSHSPVTPKPAAPIWASGVPHHQPLAGLSAPLPATVAPRSGSIPAVLGGPAGSATKTTAVLNGTGMKRQP